MAIKSEAGIYQVLEDAIRTSKDEPLTCVDLFELAAVRKHAADANKVSDFLGHMWRRGLLQRWYAPKESRAKARYAYTWLEENTDPKPAEPITRIVSSTAQHMSKPQVTITEEEQRVILDFPQFTIIVQRKD